MEATDTSSVAATGSPGVVLACQDFSAGMHALDIFEHVLPVKGKRVTGSEPSIWTFDLLRITSLREYAAAEAAAASVIIISLHDSEKVPDGVRRWLDIWTGQRPQRPGILALLLDDIVPDAGELHTLQAEALFKECAGRAGMDFFVHKSSGRRGFEDFGPVTVSQDNIQAFASLKEMLSGGAGTLNLPTPGAATLSPIDI